MKRIVKSPAHKIGAARKTAIRKAVLKVAEERLAASGKNVAITDKANAESEGIIMEKRGCMTTKRVVKSPPFKVSAAEKAAVRKAVLNAIAKREASSTAAQQK